MMPANLREVDPDSPLGLTYGQEWQDQVQHEIDSLERSSQIRGLLSLVNEDPAYSQRIISGRDA
jgi:hypothetical protein